MHSKVTLINFTSGQGIACISTGNFHEGNASRYTDVILMTAKRNITNDVSQVFHFIEKPYQPIKCKELLVSPNAMKKRFIQMINNEINNYMHGRPAWIKVKINHITDPDIVEKIYEAAEAGVRVDALVRGNCAFIDNHSFNGNLNVSGIIDRYLEHSRIFIFSNGGEPIYLIGSADWMIRNLENRIEVVTPVYDPDIQTELLRIIDSGLSDTRQRHKVTGDDVITGNSRSQEQLYQYYLSKEHDNAKNKKL